MGWEALLCRERGEAEVGKELQHSGNTVINWSTDNTSSKYAEA